MAFRHGSKAELTVNAVALSAFCDSIDLKIDVDTSETTTFGKTWKTHIPGLAGASLDGGGNYDPTATTGPAAVLTALIGADPVAVLYYPGGNVADQVEHSFDAILTSYSESSPVGAQVTFKFTLLVTGADTVSNV